MAWPSVCMADSYFKVRDALLLALPMCHSGPRLMPLFHFTQMLKFLLVTVCVATASCEQNNLPRFITNKTLDCTLGKTYVDPCKLTLVVEALTSMTYYNITDDNRELKGYRATFDSKGNMVTLRPDDNVTNMQPPIMTDGHFRPIIAINGQMPGPTIIAHEKQRLIITVYNELLNVEGISIHWHGMHQRGTPKSDGVAYVTQLPIMPGQNYRYDFIASPSGTHWYHAHSGAQRTDGLYGALIIKDNLPGDLYDYDLPEQHTLLLMDWQRDASIDLFYVIGKSLNYWKEPLNADPPYTRYNVSRAADNTEVGPQPFWSAIINDKGIHYNESGDTNIKYTSLNNFNCTKGKRYRFRLIGAQALYALRFSILEHKLTVIASDGAQIKSINNVDYVIVNTGERYDIVVTCYQRIANWYMLAETLEDRILTGDNGLYNPIGSHTAKAILHYDRAITLEEEDLHSSKGGRCTSINKCKAVNCPFAQYGGGYIDCINVESFEPYDVSAVPPSISKPSVTLFYSFGFDGETTTSGSSIDGINF